jgi:hypothetical protein
LVAKQHDGQKKECELENPRSHDDGEKDNHVKALSDKDAGSGESEECGGENRADDRARDTNCTKRDAEPDGRQYADGESERDAAQQRPS